MNVQTSKLPRCPSSPCLFLLFSCVLLWEVSMTVFFPLTRCGFFCNTSEGFKKQISGFIQCLSAVDGSRHRLCILKGILINLPSHGCGHFDEDESFKWAYNLNKDVSFHFFSLGILIRSGHNLWNTSLMDRNKISFMCVLIWLVMLFIIRNFNFS